jgi:DNA-binding CsgD family transcriptional regulator
MSEDLKIAARLDTLTPKQREVVGLVAEGLTSKEIGRKLGITESAVNQRIEVVRQRLGGISRANIGRIYRQTNTLVITIPTSNSLTGKSIQLQALAALDQQSSTEGVGGFAASDDEANGELQPSTLSPILPAAILPAACHGRNARLVRSAMIVVIALGLLAIGILTIVASHIMGLVMTTAA